MSGNQTFGRHTVNRAQELAAFDRLPAALRQVFARAPYKYAIAVRLRPLLTECHQVGLRETRRQLIARMAAQLQGEARRTYGPDHPDAQRSRLARGRAA